jgi:hypothetical protein
MLLQTNINEAAAIRPDFGHAKVLECRDGETVSYMGKAYCFGGCYSLEFAKHPTREAAQAELDAFMMVEA